MKKDEAVNKIAASLWGRNIPTNTIELALLVIQEAENIGMVLSNQKCCDTEVKRRKKKC